MKSALVEEHFGRFCGRPLRLAKWRIRNIYSRSMDAPKRIFTLVKAREHPQIVAEVARTAPAHHRGSRSRRRTSTCWSIQTQRGVSARFQRCRGDHARVFTIALLCGLAGVAALVSAQTSAGRTLDIYYIDTEGGQSTLFVGPTGESLLVDTGNAGDRDLDRIVEALAAAGVKQIDHMWTTHYHGDHVGRDAGAGQAGARSSTSTITGRCTPNDRATPADVPADVRGAERRQADHVKPGDKVRDGGARHHGRRVGEPVASRPICPAAGRRESRVRRREDEGRERVHRSRQRRIGRVRDDVREVPDGRSRRPHVERRAGADVPDESHRHGRPVSRVASRASIGRDRRRWCMASRLAWRS